MKILKKIILLLILFATSFCTQDKNADKEAIPTFDTSNNKIPHSLIIEDSLTNLPIPTLADFVEFTETSGIVQTKETKLLYRPQDKGFYGFYTLFSHTLTIEPQGEVKVFSKRNDGSGWKESDTDQVFIEVIITGDKIKFLNKINIGASKADLIKVFGEPKINMVDTFVCYDNLNTIAVFIIKADKLTKIIYGRYAKQKFGDKITAEQIRSITNKP